MKKYAKILVLLLSVALAIGATLMVVGAADETAADYDLAAAIEAASDGDTITLPSNATLASAVTVGKNLTIDLGGYTLNCTAADAFIFTSAYNVKITGCGTINLAGRIVSNVEANAGVAYSFSVVGTGEGIKINHNGTAAGKPSIVETCAGTVTLRNVNILSTAASGTNLQPYFHSKSGASGVQFVFDAMSFRSTINKPSAQNSLTFALMGGDSSAKIYNSTILNPGTLLYCGYNSSTDASKVIFDVQNSHLEIVSTDNSQRSCLVWGHSSTGGNNAVDKVNGKVTLKDSFIGGNCYRAIHCSEISRPNFTVELDNSIIANTGATVLSTGGNRDTMIVRAVAVVLKNNSILSTGSASLTGNSATITAELGTRFNNETVANSSVIKWVDKAGNTVSSKNTVLDPIGNYDYPYVVLDNTDSAYNPLGADHISMHSFSYAGSMRTTSSTANSAYGWWSESAGGNGPSTLCDYANVFQGMAKVGSFSEALLGNNPCFKFWVSPTSDAPLGSTRSPGYDTYMIFGDTYSSSTAFARIENTKVAVFDFDIATDSEYGYPLIDFSCQARNDASSNTGKQSVTFLKLNTDGSFSNTMLQDFNPDVALSTEEWNHMTFVVYTDATYEVDGVATLGQAFVYVNGELLGYLNNAYASGATFIQGIRMNLIQGTPQRVGSSFLVDNLIRQRFASYLGSDEGDGLAKEPSNYILSNIPKNDTPVNENITALGLEYPSIESAIKAASSVTKDSDGNAIKVYAALNGNVYASQLVTTEGEILSNGYSVNYDPASLGVASVGNKYVYDEDYKYTANWYVGALDKVAEAAPEDFVSTTVKLGHVLNHEFNSEATYYWSDFTVKSQVGWTTVVGSDVSVTPMLPNLAELEAANANGGVISYYPIVGSTALAYYVKDANGPVNGGTSGDSALETLKTLSSGETLVLLEDLVVSAENTLFEHTTETVISLDLAGNDIIYTPLVGTLFEVGANTTLNVYSSKPGAVVLAENATAFRINDGTTVGTASATVAVTRADVNNAYINLGTTTVDGVEYPGSNMVVVAYIALHGYKGGEDCKITSDGVNYYTESSADNVLFLTNVYDGEIHVKNSLVAAVNRNGIVNMEGFSKGSKNANGRLPGFEDFIITSTITIENSVLINKLSGLSDGSNNNIVGNNGDSALETEVPGGEKHVALIFKNVASTGRLNPSNEGSRTRIQGYVAAETHGLGASYVTSDTVFTSTYKAGMTWDLIPELGISDDVLALSIPTYENGAVSYTTYNLANNGVSIEGLSNAYNLPILDKASDYATEIVTLTWEGLGENDITYSQNYVKGAVYSAVNKTATSAVVGALALTHDGTWANLPAVGSKIIESVSILPGYTVAASLSGMKANLSIFADFGINVYVPIAYQANIVSAVADGKALVPMTPVDLDNDGNDDHLKFNVTRAAKDAKNNVVLTFNVSDSYNGEDYNVNASVTINVVSYANKVLALESATAADKALMYQMLTYANAAIVYAGGAADEEINTIIGENALTDYSASIETTYDTADLSAVFAGATVDTDADLAYVLALQAGFVGTVTVKNGDSTYTFEVDENDTEIRISGMKVYNFAHDLVINAEGTIGGEAVSVTNGNYNLATFTKYHMSNEATSDVAKAFIKALYNYVMEAAAYVK